MYQVEEEKSGVGGESQKTKAIVVYLLRKRGRRGGGRIKQDVKAQS
jgi:hypothetical protein